MNSRLWDTYDGLDREHFRVRNAISRATVTLVDDSQPIQQLQTSGCAGELRSGVLRLGHAGVGSVPLVGAKVVMLHQGGYRGMNSAITVEDPRYRPTGGEGGDGFVYAIDGADSQGNGGEVWYVVRGRPGKATEMDGVSIVIGKSGETTTVDIYGSTRVTLHTPECVVSNGGTPSPVLTEAGPSTVLKADA